MSSTPSGNRVRGAQDTWIERLTDWLGYLLTPVLSMLGRSDLARLDRAVYRARRWARTHKKGAFIDPHSLSTVIREDLGVTVAALKAIEARGEGHYLVVVRDNDGVVVDRFPSAAAVPKVIEDDMGNKREVRRRDIDLVFTFQS